MKLSLIFLIGCFAIAAQASPSGYYENDLNDLKIPTEQQIQFYVQRGLIDQLHDLVDAIASKATEVINHIVDKAKNIVDSVLKNVEEIIRQSQDIAKRVIQRVLDKIEEISKQNEIARKCVNESFPSIQAAINESNKKIQICNNNGMAKSKDLMKDIQVFVDEMNTNIDNLRKIVNYCIDSTTNVASAGRCVANEGNKIKAKILEIIANATKALETISIGAINIAKETHSCVNQAITELEPKLNAIAEDIQKCINNSSKPEP